MTTRVVRLKEETFDTLEKLKTITKIPFPDLVHMAVQEFASQPSICFELEVENERLNQ